MLLSVLSMLAEPNIESGADVEVCHLRSFGMKDQADDTVLQAVSG